MNVLVVANEKYPTLYSNMRAAIAECHNVDECQDIGDKAVAMAAYCKQVNDADSVRMFNEIRIRALRRLGELFRDVDVSKCKTQKEIRAKVQESLDCQSIQRLNKYHIHAALTFAARPEHLFEESIEATQANLKRAVEYGDLNLQSFQRHLHDIKLDPEDQARIDAAWEAEKQETAEQEEIEELILAAHDEAMEEVGVTLNRKDRKKMHEIVLLIEKDIAESIRQSAHEHRISQQEVLRQGLQMWFTANGYDVKVPSTAKRAALSQGNEK